MSCALGYLDVACAAWNAHLVGAAIALVAARALYRPVVWHKVAAIVLGAWAAVRALPRADVLRATVVANAALVGIVVAVLAVWAMRRDGDIERLRHKELTA